MSEKISSQLMTAGERCHYCFRSCYPLITKDTAVGRIRICPLCYYERFGKYRGANKVILKIQTNYVSSLKKTNPEYLTEIHQRIIAELRQKIAEKIPEHENIYKVLAKILPRYVIL